MRDVVHTSLLKCLDLIALDWANTLTPHQVRMCEHKLAILTEVRRLVNDPATGITAALFNDYAPTFVDQFGQVMQREIGAKTIPWHPVLH